MKLILIFFLNLFSFILTLNMKLIEINEKRIEEWRKEHQIYDYQFKSYQNYYNNKNNKITLKPHRNGIRATSSIINDNYYIIMCTIPKVGSSTWRKFMLYLNFPQLNTDEGKKEYFKKYGVLPDAHNISKNGVKLMALQTPQVALEYYNNPKYLKVFHVRNPVTRILSAWLSKNAESSNPLPFAKYSPTFEIFIQNLTDSKIDLNNADAHIRHQYTYCDIDRGAHYDIFLRFENRYHWGYHLLTYLKLIDNPIFEGFIQDAQVPFKGADTMEVITKHYTSKTLQLVKKLYANDIQKFGYEKDVKILEEMIKEAENSQN